MRPISRTRQLSVVPPRTRKSSPFYQVLPHSCVRCQAPGDRRESMDREIDPLTCVGPINRFLSYPMLPPSGIHLAEVYQQNPSTPVTEGWELAGLAGWAPGGGALPPACMPGGV